MSRLNRDGSTVGNGNSSPNTDSSSPGWLRYVGALKSTGYFREYLEGSKPYQQLLAEAKRFYDSNLSSGLQNTGDSEGVIRDLESLVHTTKVDGEKLKEESASLPSDDGKAIDYSFECCKRRSPLKSKVVFIDNLK
jgi:hypothetical protein